MNNKMMNAPDFKGISTNTVSKQTSAHQYSEEGNNGKRPREDALSVASDISIQNHGGLSDCQELTKEKSHDEFKSEIITSIRAEIQQGISSWLQTAVKEIKGSLPAAPSGADSATTSVANEVINGMVKKMEDLGRTLESLCDAVSDIDDETIGGAIDSLSNEIEDLKSDVSSINPVELKQESIDAVVNQCRAAIADVQSSFTKLDQNIDKIANQITRVSTTVLPPRGALVELVNQNTDSIKTEVQKISKCIDASGRHIAQEVRAVLREKETMNGIRGVLNNDIVDSLKHIANEAATTAATKATQSAVQQVVGNVAEKAAQKTAESILTSIENINKNINNSTNKIQVSINEVKEEIPKKQVGDNKIGMDRIVPRVMYAVLIICALFFACGTSPTVSLAYEKAALSFIVITMAALTAIPFLHIDNDILYCLLGSCLLLEIITLILSICVICMN